MQPNIAKTYKCYDTRFKVPSRWIISGPSNCGKSAFVCNLINTPNIFIKPFANVFYFYGASLPEVELNHPNVHFIQGFDQEILDNAYRNTCGLCL